MKTLIVKYEQQVMFLVTNYPEHQFRRLSSLSPVPLQLFGVTSCKAKTIKSRFYNQHLHGEWYRLSEEMEQYLHDTLGDQT